MFDIFYRITVIWLLVCALVSLHDIKQLLKRLPAAIQLAGVIKTAVEELDKE